MLLVWKYKSSFFLSQKKKGHNPFNNRMAIYKEEIMFKASHSFEISINQMKPEESMFIYLVWHVKFQSV